MPSMSTTYTFTNTNVIDAIEMNTNFNDVKAAFNTSAVQVDGTVQATTASLGTGIVTSAKIADDTIVNADINSAAGIVDTKLATIATAGKVSNSATTATSANTASAIVARDGSGNFTAGTITAALTGTASGNLVSGGALGTPSSGTLTNCTFPTLNQNTTGSAGSVPYSGLTGSVPTWNQNTTGNAATATNVAASGITGMKQLSSTTTMYNSNGSFAIAHGIGTTPSNVIAVNGDYGAVAQALTLTTADGTYIYGKMLNTTANTAIRVNWIAFW